MVLESGDASAAKVDGPCELRIFEPSVREAFVDAGGFVSEDARPEPADGIADGLSREFAAGEYEIPEGNLVIDVVEDAFVETFVVSADEYQRREAAESFCFALIEASALRAHEHDMPV